MPSSSSIQCGRIVRLVPAPHRVKSCDMRSLDLACLELLSERPDVQLVAPGAAILMRKVPERIRDRRWLQQILVLYLRTELPEQRHVDTAIDVDVRDVDTLRMQIARHHLRKAAHRELGGRKAGRSRPRPNTRRRAGNQNRTAAARKH